MGKLASSDGRQVHRGADLPNSGIPIQPQLYSPLYLHVAHTVEIRTVLFYQNIRGIQVATFCSEDTSPSTVLLSCA